MFHAKSVPSCYMAKCMTTTAYVINRLPKTRLVFISPFQKLWNLKPNASHFKAFDCICYVFVQDYLRTKFDKMAIQCVFVGYDTESRGWKCCDHGSNKCYVS